jgi:hypothetical protein
MLSDNLFSEIMSSNARFQEYAANGPAVDFGEDDVVDANCQASNMIDSSSFVNDSQYTISIDGASCSIDNALLKTSHIEYAVTLTRTSDGETVTVMKRYKEVLLFMYFVRSSETVN